MQLSDLLQLSAGYWGTATLQAGIRLDLFTPLAAEPLTAEQLAKRLTADRRALAMLLDALTALGLLVKEGEQYRCTELSATRLSRSAEGYLGHIIRHHHHLVTSWHRLDEAVMTGLPVRSRLSHEAAEEEREDFLMGMFNLASLIAPQLAERIDLSGRQRMLDLAGGPGTYAVHFCRHTPELHAVVFDLPSTRPFAEQTIARFGLEDRVSFRAGDVTVDDFGSGYDLVWISHLLHSEDPASAAAIVQKAVEALAPGGQLLIQEFILDDDRTSPFFPALFSLNMLVGTPGGQSYAQSELLRMMAETGLVDVQRLSLNLSNGAGVLAGTVPL